MKEYAVIFDLDGTLWDVTDAAVYSANTIAKKYGLTQISSDTVQKTFGCTCEGSALMYFPDLPLATSVNIVNEIIMYTADYLCKHSGKIYPDLVETLEKLGKKYALYIVSNSSKQDYVKSFITSSNTEKYFDGFYSVGYLGLTKGQGIGKIVKDNNFVGAVYVGDTEIDYESAQEAGVPFIYANYGFGEVSGAKHIINGLAELPVIVNSIFFNKQQ